MPDFERNLREIQLALAPDDVRREIIAAKHAGEDKARWEVVGVAVLCAVIYLIFHIITI